MGVPGFVAWLYTNHKKTNFIFKQLLKSNIDITDIKNNNFNLDFDLQDQQVNSIEHLLIDTNCLIHPQARQVCIDNPQLVEHNNDLLEKKIIKQIINYIQLLIDQTKPTKTIYIAVDGVAPMSKIKHQRLRRFKTIYDRKVLETIGKKYNKILPKEWNTSAITPGTIFMDKLMKSILSWIKTTTFNCKVIFSSSYTPGEGEHKILQYIKSINLWNPSNKHNTDNIVIYGLDADLLFLSLAVEKQNIFLMRETSQMEINGSHLAEGFSYLSIDTLNELIRNEMISRLPSTKEWCQQSLVTDFVFLCYFCGNDFLPNIPSLTLKPHNNKIINGIETIIESYTNMLSSIDIDQKTGQSQGYKYLINILYDENNNKQIKINKAMFKRILEILSDQETEYYNNFYKSKRYLRRSNKTDNYEYNKENYEENIIDNYYDPVKLGDNKTDINEWKRKYYKHYFHINVDHQKVKLSDDNSLNVILDEYIKGLVWTTYYYYDKCKDYEWFYENHHGPFISDLLNYINRFPDRINFFEKLYGMNTVWYENQIKPLQQLMLVLPHESSFLVPVAYRNIMFGNKLNNYFPKRMLDIKIDYLYKSKAWQNIPMIPIISAREVIKLTSKVILKEENERNSNYQVYVKNYINQ